MNDTVVSQDFVIDLGAPPSLSIAGTSARFPVRRIYCVGRNYAEHAREMGHDPDREPPFFFMKPATSIVADGTTLSYPAATRDVHHEIELVVALGRTAINVDAERALDHVWGYTVGLDMTRRDLQGEAKKLGRPWEMGKSFDASAPCGTLRSTKDIGHPARGAIWLEVNGVRKQEGDLSQQIWNVQEQIAHLSRLVTLLPGDLIYTGTPAGVGPVQKGDRLKGHIDGVGELNVQYAT
ncbi:MAG TPA: fumarylacetoacetate hydrolase family protein [Casimicrobiaceae bacterium]|nr:fumarylacetoacetate hydrolase family protein [Casimicrobiaceae bacterium]